MFGSPSKRLQLELDQQPQLQHPSPTRHFSQKEKTLIQEEINSLMKKKAIEEVPPDKKEIFSNMFLVPKKNGSKRPVLNLRPLNAYVVPQRFKMESLQIVKQIIQHKDWMGSIDLSDTYLHVPIHEDHRNLLQFRCDPDPMIQIRFQTS